MTLIRFVLALALFASLPSAPAAPVPTGAIEAIDRMALEDIEKKKVPSYAVAVVKDGALVLARGYGFADLENDVPAMAETVYRLGSVTKQFTALAIMQLVEAGKLSLDDELTKFFSDYPTAGHKVTVHHLLNHTSGIKSYTDRIDFLKEARLDMSHDQVLAVFKNGPFDFAPGTKWTYNNSGYYLLGMIIEKVSGQSYEQYLTEHIFRPLGMSATQYGHMRPLIRHRAMGYKNMLDSFVNDDPISMNPAGAAGALVSNVLDLVKWHQALEQGKLLSSASYEAMYRETKLADGSAQTYGYGWMLKPMAGHKKLSHGGGINGFSSMIARYPDDRLAIIVLANASGGHPMAIENRIAKTVLGIEEKSVVDLPVEETLAKRLIGRYRTDKGRVTIEEDEGKLYLTPKDQPRELLMYQGDREFVSTRNPNIRLKFSTEGETAKGFEIEMFGQTMMSAKRDE